MGQGGTKVIGAQQDIVERADGVPLFVEEMTKAVLEAEGEGEPPPPVMSFAQHLW